LSGRRRRTILASCDGLGKWINGVWARDEWGEEDGVKRARLHRWILGPCMRTLLSILGPCWKWDVHSLFLYLKKNVTSP
jgi:hypothetical protein